jgi:hypothetical protein
MMPMAIPGINHHPFSSALQEMNWILPNALAW